LRERVGVCRDFVHLAITLCRCMHIPARYCTGYLGDIGVPPAPYPMDCSAWLAVFLGGQWYAFDPRHHGPRMGRVLMARGRDATDTALATTFGVHQLASFIVWTDDVSEEALRQPRSSPRTSVIECRRMPYVEMDRDASSHAHDVTAPRHPTYPGVEP
jgi:transglutaminase-like putative cysteine protease